MVEMFVKLPVWMKLNPSCWLAVVVMVNVWLGLGAATPVCQFKTEGRRVDCDRRRRQHCKSHGHYCRGSGRRRDGNCASVSTGARPVTTELFSCTVTLPGETHGFCSGPIQLPPVVAAVAVHWVATVLLRAMFWGTGKLLLFNGVAKRQRLRTDANGADVKGHSDGGIAGGCAALDRDQRRWTGRVGSGGEYRWDRP